MSFKSFLVKFNQLLINLKSWLLSINPVVHQLIAEVSVYCWKFSVFADVALEYSHDGAEALLVTEVELSEQ